MKLAPALRGALIACAALAAACSTPAAPKAGEAAIVDAPAGKFRGQAAGGLRIFKGIPYAAPPIGDLRWKPPVAAAKWSGERDATAFGAACMQPVATAGLYASNLGSISEDCLTLNVWAAKDAKRAPVFVWIHGGALRTGSSKETTYDGARMAHNGVIVVSINYRLGVLGYMAHPELSAESSQGVSGNYGTLDQIEALRWIKANIASFGGDPNNVTIAGESAGGLSVMYLLASPAARGLFHKAIAESAYMISTPELKQQRFGEIPAETIGTLVATRVKAANIAAMRAMDARQITEAAAAGGYAPFGTVDGKILTRQLVETFDKGEQAKVPLLAGFNSGEIRSLLVLAPPIPANAAAYVKAIRDRYGALGDEYLRLYPSTSLRESVLAASRDAIYGWTAERLARKQAEAGQRSYLYLFDHGYPAADNAGLHAFHASELPYVFGNARLVTPNWPKIPDTAEEKRLSDAMLGYWTSFAATGNPRAKGEPDWPAYGSARAFMTFADKPQPGARLMPGMYELHEQVTCRRKAAGNIVWNFNIGVVSPPLPPAAPGC